MFIGSYMMCVNIFLPLKIKFEVENSPVRDKFRCLFDRHGVMRSRFLIFSRFFSQGKSGKTENLKNVKCPRKVIYLTANLFNLFLVETYICTINTVFTSILTIFSSNHQSTKFSRKFVNLMIDR